MTRESPKSVSDAELHLLKVLWERGPSTVRQLLDGLGKAKPRWAYTTAQTLLMRLVQKGYVTATKQGRTHLFEAAVAKDDLIGQELRDLAARVCEGDTAPLMLALVEQNTFSASEVRRLRELLDRIEQDRGETARPGRKARRGGAGSGTNDHRRTDHGKAGGG